MDRKSWSHVKMTRELADDPDLWKAHQASIVTMMTLAKIADDRDARQIDVHRAATEWRVIWAEVEAATVKAGREAAWESRRPRAV